MTAGTSPSDFEVSVFVIEDDTHAEEIGSYTCRADAMNELRRLQRLVWDEDPNRAPCQSWRTCSRSYVLVEYDTSVRPWRQIDCTAMFEISSAGLAWPGLDEPAVMDQPGWSA